MASKKTAVSGEATAADDEVNATSEPTYPLEVLQKHCLKLFGVSTPTFVGATTGIEAREYTVNEMKGIIEKWCRQEVK